jgi:hypothetical protein
MLLHTVNALLPRGERVNVCALVAFKIVPDQVPVDRVLVNNKYHGCLHAVVLGADVYQAFEFTNSY